MGGGIMKNPISIRLLSQQLASPQYYSPSEVVAHMGAIQAQDYRMVRWAVIMRTRHPSAEAFRKAFDNGEIIRLHLLRGTWQLVSADDYWWMLALCSAKAETTIRSWMRTNRVDIDNKELHSIRDILVSVCQTQGSATKDDFAKALSKRGIAIDSHRLSYHIRLAEISGVLGSGILSSMHATYSLAEEKVRRTPLPERDEMLCRLARKYFQSHSPATFDDWQWWSGLSAAECRRAIETLRTELYCEQWHDYNFYIHDSCRIHGFRKNTSLLLPPFDEYLIGYKSRGLVLAPEHSHHAHTNNGIFFPIVAYDGMICGNWHPWQNTPNISTFTALDKELPVSKQWKNFRKLF